MNRRQKLIQQQFLNNEAGIIKRLEQVYKQAQKDIDGNIEKLMERFDPETGDLPQSAVYQLKYQKMLKDQIDGVLNQMQTKQFLHVSDYLNTCYEDGFVGSLFDLHGQGVPLMMPLDQEAMVTAVQLDSKISQGLYTRLGEDVSMLKKHITAQVSRSIATGMTFAQTAKQLSNRTRIGYNNAIRIARTEGHRIQNQATMNVMEQAKERGADVVKRWDATLDGKTRESHVFVDGEIRELNERFSNGLMFPGDPAGGAAEVVNCRCAVLQRARWAVGGSFAKWNNFTRQIEEFDSPEAYGDFKKGFFSPENKEYMNYVQQMEDKYHTKNFESWLGGMTDKEYDKFSLLTVNNPVFIKKGLENGVNSGTMRLGVIRDAVTSGRVSTKVNVNKQNRHIPGSKGFIDGRSRLDVDIEEVQKLVNELAGTGDPIFDNNGDWTGKERVTCPRYIGTHVNASTGEEVKTKNLTIIYSNTGSHIVPRRDDE